MVSEVEFYAVLVGLYGFECAARLPLGDLAFVHYVFRDHYYPRIPAQISGSKTWGWVLLNPLWPARPPFRVPCVAFILGESGVVLHDDARRHYGCRLIEFGEMTSLRVSGERVLITDTDSIECLSTTEAACLCTRLERLRALPPEERSRAIEAYEQQVSDLDSIRREIRRFSQDTRVISHLSCWMIVLMFAGFPLLAGSIGFTAGVLLFIILAVITSIITAALCHRLTARLDAQASTFARWMHTLHLAFYPLAVPRCLDGLYLRHFQLFDATAIAYLIGGRQLAERFGQYYLAQVARMEATADSQAVASELARHRNRQTAILSSFLKQIGSNLESILESPTAAGPDCQSYCPVCFVQYKLANGTCPDCGGVALQPLNAIPTKRDSA